MELQTIRQVSLDYGITRRMLCYYEDVGLLVSRRKDGYAYRVYDVDNIKRLQQIIILRKLQIPVKQIKNILNNQDAVTTIEIFKQNISELDEEIAALSVVKSILSRFVEELQEKADVRLKLDLLNDTTMLSIVNTLSFSENKIKERVMMEELNKASDTLRKFDEVQYVNLSPARAVAFNAIGREPEGDAAKPVFKWIEENNLKGTARIYLFNIDPYPTEENPEYGMGCCATIPEGIEIPEHLYELKLPGGIYAVISDYEGDPSHGWAKMEALLSDPKWEWEYDGREGCRGHEEHIERADGGFIIPVMLPVKKKQNKE